MTRFANRTHLRRPERRATAPAVRVVALVALAAVATVRSATLPSFVWFREGTRYIDVRPNPAGGVDLVQVRESLARLILDNL